MPWSAIFFASGDAGLIGAALIAISAVAGGFSKSLLTRAFGVCLAILGFLLLALSAAVPPTVPLIAYAGLTAIWALLVLVKRHRAPRKERAVAIAVVLASIVFLGIELPRAFDDPERVSGEISGITVIGDSLSAGIDGDASKNWPSLLARRRDVAVQNLSTAGARLTTAIHAVERAGISHSVVVMEIGGNDLLGSTSAEAFRERLAALIRLVARDGRIVYMFELPLPPFSNSYGRAQREIAREFGVRLIPRRKFAWLLAEDGSTVDGLHLSDRGCERMESLVWGTLKRDE